MKLSADNIMKDYDHKTTAEILVEVQKDKDDLQREYQDLQKLYEKKVPGTSVWKWNPNGMDWGLGAWECSNCGCKNNNLPSMNKGKTNPFMFAGSKYCPNCGKRIIATVDNTLGGEFQAFMTKHMNLPDAERR